MANYRESPIYKKLNALYETKQPLIVSVGDLYDYWNYLEEGHRKQVIENLAKINENNWMYQGLYFKGQLIKVK